MQGLWPEDFSRESLAVGYLLSEPACLTLVLAGPELETRLRPDDGYIWHQPFLGIGRLKEDKSDRGYVIWSATRGPTGIFTPERAEAHSRHPRLGDAVTAFNDHVKLMLAGGYGCRGKPFVPVDERDFTSAYVALVSSQV